MAGRARTPGQSVIGKVALVLDSVAAGGPATLTTIAHATGLPVSTTHRLVAELVTQRLLVRDEQGAYRPGLALRALADLRRQPDPAELASATLDDLCRSTGAPAYLAVLDGITVVATARARPGSPSTAAAIRLPVHATAAGKALLAFSPDYLVEQVVARGLRRWTPATITSDALLRRTLAHVRRTRTAVACGEHVAGRGGVAAPVFGPGGHVVAALELAVQDLPTRLPLARAALAVAAAAMTRDVLHASAPDPRRSVPAASVAAGGAGR